MHTYHFRPTDILTNDSSSSSDANGTNTAVALRNSLIILNQPLKDVQRLKHIWSSCNYKVCADGGSNRLSDCLSRNGVNVDDYFLTRRPLYTSCSALIGGYRRSYTIPSVRGGKFLIKRQLPDAIVGDLDSIRPEVLKYYETEKHVPIERDNDLYSTDFAKSMRHVLAQISEASSISTTSADGKNAANDSIIIMSSLGGRVDQGIGLLHELYRESQNEQIKDQAIKLWLITESSVSFLLSPGLSVIEGVSSSNNLFTENAGILPVYGPAVITIRGFEWDVEDWVTEMGGQVSTSNHIKKDTVEIETDKPVLFTIEFAEEQ